MGKTKSLGRNALLNAIKQACAILFPLITFTYSTRVLGKNNIGIYSFSNSIISYIILLSGLGISTYSVREGARIRDDRKALNTFANEVFSINIISMLVAYIVLGLLFCFWKKLTDYALIIIIQSLSVILNTLGADWINTIEEDYPYLTIRYIVLQIISLLLLFLFVKTKNDLIAYTLINVLANTGGNIFNILYIRRYVNLRFTIHFDWWKHLKPMLILFSSNVASVIYLNSDLTILGILTNEGNVGIYTVASKIYQLLKTLINAVVLVTIPRFSYYISNKMNVEYSNTYHKMIQVLMYLVFPCAIGLFMKATNIIYIVGGEEYISGEYSLRILSFSFVFAVGACLFCHSVLIPNKKESIYLLATCISALLNITLNFILIPIWGINAAAFTTLLSEIIMFLITMLSSLKFQRINLNIKEMFIVILGCVSIAFICIFSSRIFGNRVFDLLFSVVLSSVFYYLITLFMRHPISLEIRKYAFKLLEKR